MYTALATVGQDTGGRTDRQCLIVRLARFTEPLQDNYLAFRFVDLSISSHSHSCMWHYIMKDICQRLVKHWRQTLMWTQKLSKLHKTFHIYLIWEAECIIAFDFVKWIWKYEGTFINRLIKIHVVKVVPYSAWRSNFVLTILAVWQIGGHSCQ